MPCFLTLILMFAPIPKDALEEEKFHGEWESNEVYILGEKEKGGSYSLVIDKDMKARITNKKEKENSNLRISINPSAKPKEINLLTRNEKDPNKEDNTYGIYEFDGKTLKLFLAPPESSRPKSFDTTKEKAVLLIFKKVK